MEYRIDLVVLEEDEQGCRFGLTFHNLSDNDLDQWQLSFIFDRYIQPESVSNSAVTQIGTLCTLKPNSTQLIANHHYYCEFSIGSKPLRYYSDGIKEAQVCFQANGITEHQSVSVTPIVLASLCHKKIKVPIVTVESYPLIPKPNTIEFKGLYTNFSSVTLHTVHEYSIDAGDWLKEELARIHRLDVVEGGDLKIKYEFTRTLEDSEYRILIDAQAVTILSSTPAGFVHACATLLQLVKVNHDSFSLPLGQIKDKPRFRYRGMMLDCARHFHSVEQIKRIINQLAHYKYNTFHWHLTDDEGWRIEIKSFPQLTEIGAWRGKDEALEAQYSHIDKRHGGFYSQEQIKSVVEYAQQRGIMVIPEIDIPGHCRAAIKSLPHLLVEKEDHTRYRSIQHYNDNVLNPALSGTYLFLDKVLTEIAQLFPAPYVHIGADEVPDGVWSQSPQAQQLMQENGYQDTKELQGHLLRYAEKKLSSLGKRMLGWEEAQHGNKVSKDTVIYSWLSEEAAIHCARQGFDVVLQPAQTTYLDMAQDYSPDEPGVDWANPLPLERAYRYEPLADISDNDPIRKRIWGLQTALWCEIINHQSRIDYMLFPRLTALAEAGWTDKVNRNWEEYISRLKAHLPLLDSQEIEYRSPWK